MAALNQSYVHGASEVPLIGETIGQFFDAVCDKHASRPVLVVRHQKVRLTYGELRNEVDKLAAGLLTLGLEPGDRIGIWSPNNSEWVLTQFATAKAGLILVNINPSYRVTELEYALNKVGCKALILAERFKTSDYVGMLRELAPELGQATPGKLETARLPALRSVVLLGDSWHPGTFKFRDSFPRRRRGGQAHRRACAPPAIRRADQHPVHLGHHGFPQGRDAVAP
jgi:fatty-acyl-CoA synthase